MTTYSGRTTSHLHKGDDWASNDISGIRKAVHVVTETRFDVQWSDCPVEVEEEVRRLWQELELKNGDRYEWERDADIFLYPNGDPMPTTLKEAFPIIDQYLMAQGVAECIVTWWW